MDWLYVNSRTTVAIPSLKHIATQTRERAKMEDKQTQCTLLEDTVHDPPISQLQMLMLAYGLVFVCACTATPPDMPAVFSWIRCIDAALREQE